MLKEQNPDVMAWGELYSNEEKVKIKIPKNNDGGESAVPVCLNGYNYFIKRGVSVEVPKTVCDVLKYAGYLD